MACANVFPRRECTSQNAESGFHHNTAAIVEKSPASRCLGQTPSPIPGRPFARPTAYLPCRARRCRPHGEPPHGAYGGVFAMRPSSRLWTGGRQRYIPPPSVSAATQNDARTQLFLGNGCQNAMMSGGVGACVSTHAPLFLTAVVVDIGGARETVRMAEAHASAVTSVYHPGHYNPKRHTTTTIKSAHMQARARARS